MRHFEYRDMRAGLFSLLEGTGPAGASRSFRVDVDHVGVGELGHVMMVVAGGIRLIHEESGATQDLRVGEGSYEDTLRHRGQIRAEAIEDGSRFICVSPAGSGRRIRHQQVDLRFGESYALTQKQSLLLLGAGEVDIEGKLAASPSIVWVKGNGRQVFARTTTRFIEFWLE